MNPILLQINGFLCVAATTAALVLMIAVPMRRLAKFILYGSAVLNGSIIPCIASLLRHRRWQVLEGPSLYWYQWCGIFSLVVFLACCVLAMKHRSRNPCPEEEEAKVRSNRYRAFNEATGSYESIH